MPEPAIRAAIFDFGGVMTEPLFRDHSHVADELQGIVAYFLSEFRDVYHLPTGAHDIHLLETGQIGDHEFFQRLCARWAALGNEPVDPDVAAEAVWGKEMVACGAMVDAVRQLRGGGIRTALLTNISKDGGWLWQTIVPSHELFDVVIDSSVVGMRKPDPAIFHLTCERLGVPPEECIFVDDIASNIAAAAALGIRTYQCDDPVACADEVVRALLGHGAADEAGETAAS